MTAQEFSNEFDILYNNIMSNQAPGLDDYEKSVFLTKSQEEVVISMYNGKNPFGDSFENTEEVRRYLSNLTKTYKTEEQIENHTGLSDSSVFFRLPEDLWFITYESADLENSSLECAKGNNTPVIPITQDEYHRIKKNPFRNASERRVLRLDLENGDVEIISKYKVKSYSVRYLSKPAPIILTDLPEGISINGVSAKTDCMLNPVLHRAILDGAVKLAKLSMSSIER